MKTYLLLLICFLPVIALTQEDQDVPDPLVGIVDNILYDMETGTGDSAFQLKLPESAINAIAAEIAKDSLFRQKNIEAWKAYYEYKIEGFDHRHRSFEWQLVSSKIIFFTVLVLVIVGIIFSGIQFKKAMKEGISETTTAEVSPTGLKFSSSVLGVIILFISLMFFYLYLIYIYPISEIF